MATEEKKKELLEKLRNAVIQYDEDAAKEAAQRGADRRHWTRTTPSSTASSAAWSKWARCSRPRSTSCPSC